MRNGRYVTTQRTNKEIKLCLLIGRLLVWAFFPATVVTVGSRYGGNAGLSCGGIVLFIGLILVGAAKVDRWWQNY